MNNNTFDFSSCVDNEDLFDDLFIKWYDSGKPEHNFNSLGMDYGLSETLVCDGHVFETFEYDCGRWTQTMESIVKIKDRYFAISWERGLTEYQEDCFWDDKDIKEVRPVKRVKVVREWDEVH